MKPEISQYPNGLRVVAIPLMERKSVSMGIWVDTGARNESPELSGVSHFLEHIVFKGTKKRSATQIKQSIEGVGGSMNAFTSEECTCFLAKTTRRHFENVFETLADMVTDASIAEEDVKKERTVILEEIKMTQDQPSQLVEELLSEIAWPNHPLGRPIAGTLESVSGLTRDSIADYRDRYYQPNFITVAVAGDIDKKALDEAAFRAFSRGPSTHKKLDSVFRPSQVQPVVKLHDKKTEQTHLALSLHAPAKEHADESVVEILSVILGGNMSSRLFNEVREERGLAYDIGSYVRRYQDTGALVVSAGVDHKKAKDALSVILAELEKTAREPVAEDELKRAKDFYLGQFELGLENSMNQMLWAGESALTLGRLKTQEEVIEKIERVSVDDILRVAQQLFVTRSLSLAMVGPSLSDKDFRRLLSFARA